MKPCLWTGMYAEHPLDRALDIMADCGWKVFEISTEHLDGLMKRDDMKVEIDSCRETMANRSLETPQAHGFLGADIAHPDESARQRDIDHVRRHIEICSMLGVETMVLHPGGRNLEQIEKSFALKENRQPLSELGDYCAEYGMKLAIENMMWEPFTTAQDMLDLVEYVDHPSVGLTFDTSHAHVVGIDVGSFAAKLGSRLIATHISDNDGSGDQHKIPGNGTINWDNLMKALGDMKYSEPLNFEIPGERVRSIPMRNAKTRHALDIANVLIECCP